MCEEKSTLFEKYNFEVREYSEGVIRLRDLVRAIPNVEFMLLWDIADRIRRRCEATHRELQRHVREHGC